MNQDKDFKIYMIILCSIVLYSIFTVLGNVPLNILGISIADLSNSDIRIYTIIYQVFAISISAIFFLSWLKEPYEKFINQLKKYITGLGAIIVYFVMSEMQLVPFQLFDINIQNIPTYLKIIYLLCYDAILIGFIILIHFKKIKQDINDIKIKHNNYFKSCLKYWLIALFIMYISNFIISFVGTGLPSNEELIREQFQISPIYIFISAVIFAPLLEELIFRQSLQNLFRNKWLFIIISGLVFGGMHVFTHEITSFVDVLYLIPYSVPGIAFAYMLSKTNNILVSMGFHALHNGIMVALQFLLIYYL